MKKEFCVPTNVIKLRLSANTKKYPPHFKGVGTFIAYDAMLEPK